jgi:HipA-like C-terminal domain
MVASSSPVRTEILTPSPLAALHQERLPVPTTPPTKLRRAGSSRKSTWDLPRSFVNYTAVVDTSIGGKATKWVLRNHERATDFYIAKFGNKNGTIEVLTELFNNQLGTALGFEMAHSGVARLDDHPYFVTKNFRASDEALVHGSLMIETIFGAPKATEQIDFKHEQAFYSVDVVRDVIFEFCQKDAEQVFRKFIEMLVLDALIGAMDRHAQNWGVLQTTTTPNHCRLAPIFDTARALFWDVPDGRLAAYETSSSRLQKYIENSKPCIGPESNHPKKNSCNHFDLVMNLMRLYSHQTTEALQKIPTDADSRAAIMLSSLPFGSAFSDTRKRLIVKTLGTRSARLRAILEEGG